MCCVFNLYYKVKNASSNSVNAVGFGFTPIGEAVSANRQKHFLQ